MPAGRPAAGDGASVNTANTAAAYVGLACAGAAALILVVFLARRPPLTPAVKVWLLVGIGILPAGAAITGHWSGMEETKRREFCASCHPMRPYVADAENPRSTSLASTHARNRRFGAENCYMCHRDYRLFGGVTTKVTGMKHLWAYYSGDYVRSRKFALYAPFPNSTCRQCHSGDLRGFMEEPEHETIAAKLASDAISCVTEGCHGPAHPPAVAP